MTWSLLKPGKGNKAEVNEARLCHKSNPANTRAAGASKLGPQKYSAVCCFKGWHPLFCHPGLHQREAQRLAECTYGTATFSLRVYVAQHLLKVTTLTTALCAKILDQY